MSDGKRMATNIIASWGANLVKVAVQLVMLPVMARVLGPSEMGLYALALPILALVMPLADAGLANSLAREAPDNHRVWSTSFWMLMFISCLLAVSVYGGSFGVAHTSNQPRLPQIVLALCTIFPLMGLGVLPMARMIQKGRLIAPAIIDMTSNLLGAGLGIAAALSGYGVWSMVAQYVSTFAIRVFLLNACEFYWPHLVLDFRGLKSHLGLGGSITLSKIAESAGRVAENSQVSRISGASALGAYGFANQVARFLSEAVGNSLWANLYYQSLHCDHDRLGPQLIRMNRLLCHILIPASFLAAALSPTFLPFVLGDKWLHAGWPLAIFCLTYPFTIMSNLVGAVLYARGYAIIPMTVAVLTACARFAAIYLLLPYGLMAACVGVGAISILQAMGSFLASRPVIGFRISHVVIAAFWPVAAALLGFWGAFTILLYRNDIEGGLYATACFTTIYLLAQIMFDRSRFLADAKGIMGLVVRRKAKAETVA